MRKRICAGGECGKGVNYRLSSGPGLWKDLCRDCLRAEIREAPDQVFKIWDLAAEGGGAKDVTADLMIEAHGVQGWAEHAVRIAKNMGLYRQERIGNPDILTSHARIAYSSLQILDSDGAALDLVRAAINRDTVAV